MLLKRYKDDLEMTYWRKVLSSADMPQVLQDRYERAIEIWKIGRLGKAIEIGPGPLGGVLGLLEASEKVGLDPLYDRFREEGLLKQSSDIECWTGCLERGELRIADKYKQIAETGRGTFHAAVTINALDHGEGGFDSLSPIADFLKRGGRFYLHVHLRRPKQENSAHDHVLKQEDYEREYRGAGFEEVWKQVFATDPLVDSTLDRGIHYRAIMAILEKV